MHRNALGSVDMYRSKVKDILYPGLRHTVADLLCRCLGHGDDTYTDIITFDYVEGDVVSGDILISIDRVRDNAQKYAVTFEQELHRVMIHGVLHLLGNGDKSEKEAAKMRQLENAALKIWDGIK